MGFLDELLGKKEEEPQRPGLPFNIKTSLRPVRLTAKKESCLEVDVTVKNVGKDAAMTSLSLELPKALGFENLGITKIKEIRIGSLPPQKERVVGFSVCSNYKTPAGTYSVLLTVNQHYRDYKHIVNYAKRTVEIRVI